MLLLCRSGLSTALPPRGQLLEGPPHPGGPAGWRPLQGGCLSPVLTHRSGCWGHFLWRRSPRATHQGCTSGAQLLPSPTSPGPRHLGLRTPRPLPAPSWPAAGTLLNPRGQDQGLPGLQMVPRSRRLAQAPGDRGRRAQLGGWGAAWGGCLAGAFPSSDRWSRIRAVAPPGWRLDLARGERSAVQGQRQCPGMGWRGPGGTSWLCHWCHAARQPRVIASPLCLTAKASSSARRTSCPWTTPR